MLYSLMCLASSLPYPNRTGSEAPIPDIRGPLTCAVDLALTFLRWPSNGGPVLNGEENTTWGRLAMDLERYTQKAKQAILDAQQRAMDFRHSSVEPVHLLLALLRP